eukprot:gene2302-2841_t
MDNIENLNFDSIATKRVEVRGPVNPLSTPIYLSSTYVMEDADHGAKLCSHEEVGEGQSPWLYTRWGNPTTDVAERLVSTLEGAYGTHITASGMSAISSAVLALVRNGDHVVVSSTIYGGSYELFTKVLPSYGVEVTFVDQSDIENYKKAATSRTKLFYGESPANPTMVLVDLEKLGQLGKELNIVTLVDSTFASVYNQQPIKSGIDITLHSATKYYGGHSDLIAGTISSATRELHEKIGHFVRLLGGCSSAHNSFLLQRGIKTIHLRMERHNSNALAIANYLEKHPKVNKVFYTGLESHPQHELAKKQMKPGFGGMISFDVKGGLEGAKQFVNNLNLINLAVSLGGVESLIELASTMSHTMAKDGILDGLLRLSVGCENVDDLISDMERAFTFVKLNN